MNIWYWVGIISCVLFVIPPIIFVLAIVLAKKKGTATSGTPTTPLTQPPTSWPKTRATWNWVTSKSRFLVVFAVWVFITLTFKHFYPQVWEKFFDDHKWWAYLAYIVATIGFCYLFGRKGTKTGGAPSTIQDPLASMSGGKKVLAWVTILFLVAMGLEVWEEHDKREHQTKSRGSWSERGFREMVVTSEKYGVIQVPEHTFVETVLFNPDDCLWVQKGNDPPLNRCGSVEPREVIAPIKVGNYTMLIKPVGKKEVRFLYRLTGI